MRVLIVGSGGREHALAWKIGQSPKLDALFVAPGNAGIARLAAAVPSVRSDDEIIALARGERIDLVVVGPEAPLATGLVDRLLAAGIAAFGPTAGAARIESSKAFAKQLMFQHGIPTAAARIFDDPDEALAYVRTLEAPPVVKADGIASGKGVTVPATREEAEQAVVRAMLDREYGAAGARVLVEERLEGREASAHALSDGRHVLQLPFARDYKRALDGDRGPNTGGMGAYSPLEDVTPELEETVQRTVTEPTIAALAAEGAPFRGLLYPGLMLTPDGPKVIEFNARFGDPETQVLLPRIESDLLDLLWACATGDLGEARLRVSPKAAVGVVMASGGYPGPYRTGVPIEGLESVDDDVLVFHAGTALNDSGQLVTSGGRVLTVVALGDTVAQATARAYDNVGRIRFEGAHVRRDIAAPAGFGEL
ncbi:MAG TPA: phosphoribosylamine--glycine ligase [Dehalococcoidia bacterium]|nr:phosphoribosylamine--glycine ligase [Dehalococcoidia bacterium]